MAAIVLACLFVAATVQVAAAAWVPVMEDSVDLKLTISSLTLDSTHFASPTLLVGTYRDTTGLSLLMTVDPLTLEPIDTVYRSTYVPKVCRAADLNADSKVDLLVSLTSVAGDSTRFSSVVAVYGPDYHSADTLPLPRTALDLLVDESRQEFWLGSRYDTTFSYVFGCASYSWQYIGSGGSYSFGLDLLRDMGGSRAVTAFTVTDINSDDVSDLVALWAWTRRDWSSGCGPEPNPSWSTIGVWQLDGTTGGATAQAWEAFYNAFDDYDDIQAYVQLPVADFDQDGYSEAVLSWRWRHLRRGYPLEEHVYAEVISLAGGQRLWERTLPATGSGSFSTTGPYTAILYDLDQSAPPELLLVGTVPPNKQYTLYALRGDTGDSLFAAQFREVSGLSVVHSVAAGESAKVIHATTSWLYRWHIGLAASASDGSEQVIPNRFLLRANAPNPFNAETRISYTLAYPMDVNLTVYDALGRLVTVVVDSHQAGGDHVVTWNGKNSAGVKVPSGVYFLRLSSGDEFLVRKMALLK